MSSYPTLGNCLFGAVSLTENVDIDKYKYSGNGIKFGTKKSFFFGNGFGCNLIIFWVDMSSYVHVANKEKDNLIIGGKKNILYFLVNALHKD